uniref:separase n=2 Tax=Ornithodoros turicata TaxID=34597 RepID=A0A2R5LD27_9ACAR
MKTTDPALWWSIRRALDKRLKELTESIENIWMGCWKCVFNGKPASSAYQQALNSTVTQVLSKAAKHKLECCSRRLLEAVVGSVADLSAQQLSVAVCQLFGITSTHLAHNALVQIMENFDKGPTKRHPVILILGKTIQAFPWESVPILRKNSVSRVPSLAYLHAQLNYYQMMTENVYVKGVDSRKTYFILNPSNDIPKTQAQFEVMFRKEGWPGVCGKPPEKEEFQSAIAGQDLILYCGHGSGREYLCGDVIEQMLCHACPILMGCGSGRLKVFGSRIEPVGVVLQYWLGGSPCVVANLWEVTDRDIDRFTEELLRLWIPQLVTKDHVPDITTAVQSSRKACKLQHLVGAAPVVYGIPVLTLPFKAVQFDEAA